MSLTLFICSSNLTPWAFSHFAYINRLELPCKRLLFLQYLGVDTMLDLMLKVFSSVLGMNMRDHHDIPFALPLLFFIFLGFFISMIVLHFIGNEEQEDLE
jgi:hypothetical protein